MLRAWKITSPGNRSNRAGYILVEILAAVAIFLFAVGTLFIQANKWQEYCYKNQVRLVAHILRLICVRSEPLFKGIAKGMGFGYLMAIVKLIDL